MASIKDKITRTTDGSSYPNVARVVSPRAPGSDTLLVDGLSGWSEDTAMHFISYRLDSAEKVVEGSVRDCIGVANKRTGNIVGFKVLLGGNDEGNKVGDIIQPGPSTLWSDYLAQALLNLHDSDGTLKEHVVEDKNIAKNSITAESIKDGSITADKIDLATHTDANGWTIHSFGGIRMALKTVNKTQVCNQYDVINIQTNYPVGCSKDNIKFVSSSFGRGAFADFTGNGRHDLSDNDIVLKAPALYNARVTYEVPVTFIILYAA